MLQRWRIAKAAPHIQPGDRVLDLGSSDGVIFQRIRHCGPGSMGIDPLLKNEQTTAQGFRLIPGYFPRDLPKGLPSFDVIVMLAVLEHFPESEKPSLARGCADCLRPGGRLVITVPSPAVDRILEVLLKFRLVDGMSLEEHHGFDPLETPNVFGVAGFRLLQHQAFQSGLNHLFVFERNLDTAIAQGQ